MEKDIAEKRLEEYNDVFADSEEVAGEGEEAADFGFSADCRIAYAAVDSMYGRKRRDQSDR